MAIVYQLITADGVTFNLSGAFADGGYSVSSPPYVPDGVGFPPIKHITQDIYNMPGSLLQDIQVRPRIVDLPMQTWGNDVGAMLDARSRLINVLRWDRSLGSPPDPATLRVTVDGEAADLCVYYLSDITSTNRRAPGGLTTMGIRLIAYDPLWRSTSTTEQEISLGESATTRYFTALSLPNFELDPDSVAASGGPVYTIVVRPYGEPHIAFGGLFTNWDGEGDDDYIAYFEGGAFETVAPADARLGAPVYDLVYSADGVLYIAGNFTDAGGVADSDYICKVTDILASPDFETVGGPAQAAVKALCLASDGTLYAGGEFTDMDSIANTLRIAKWDGSDWTAMGTGADDIVEVIVEGPDGSIYAGGLFNSMGGVANTATIARWNGTAWVEVGGGFGNADVVYDLVFSDAGVLYAGGDGLDTYNNIAKWDGSEWTSLGEGTNNPVRALCIEDGMLYVGGVFTEAGGFATLDKLARWDGTSWLPIPCDLPGGNTVSELVSDGDYLYIGHANDGTGVFTAATDVTYVGSVRVYPIITVVGEGTLYFVGNTAGDQEISTNLFLSPGEIVTFDLTEGIKSVESNVLGTRLATVFPQSDLNTFALEPSPIAAGGVNSIGISMIDTVVTEVGDNNNQVTVVSEQITGLTLSNTDQGRLYVSIIDDGGGFFHIAIYEDFARSELVAHTGTYNGGGAEALIADNASGLGGTITVNAVVAADADIVIMPPFIQFEYYDKFWSLEDAVK